MTKALLIVILGIALAAESGRGAILNLDPAKECTQQWRRMSLAAEKPYPNNSLFDVSAPEKYDDFYRRSKRAECWKEWLIVVYMAADNDLSPYSHRDIIEMEGMGSLPSTDVVVFQDTFDDDGSRYLYIAGRKKKFDYFKEMETYLALAGLKELTDPIEREKRFLADRGRSHSISPVVKDFPEEDSGSLDTAARFLRWALDNYPSRRLMVVGWSHGEGFDAKLDAVNRAGNAVPGRQGGFAFDNSSRSHMAVTEMARGMKSLLSEYPQRKSIDIMGSDACLNQQVEFAYEWMDIADYVFGSSTMVQAKGFNYRALLDAFQNHPKAETSVFAKEIPQIYGKSVSRGAHGPNSSYYDPSATMATWAMPSLVSVTRSFEDLAKALNLWIRSAKNEFESIDRIEEINGVVKKTLRLGSVSNDLFNFLQNLEEWVRSKEEAAAASEKDFWRGLRRELNLSRDNLGRAVIERFIGEKYQSGLLRTSMGVAIWFPVSRQEAREMFPKFSKSRFYNAEGAGTSGLSEWAKLIEVLYPLRK